MKGAFTTFWLIFWNPYNRNTDNKLTVNLQEDKDLMKRWSWMIVLMVLNLGVAFNLNLPVLAQSKTPTLTVSTVAAPARLGPHSVYANSAAPGLWRNVAAISALRGVNYYPSANGWYYMWTNWNAVTVNHDFAKISSVLHANYVRIIVPADTNFGYPTPYATALNELAQVITLAHNHNLKVDLTLFDLFSNYSDLAGSKQWLTAVLYPYWNNPGIAFIDLQNELDNANPAAVSWARTMLPYARALSGNIPLTISVSNSMPSLAAQVSQQVPVDFYEFHFYLNPALAYATFQQALRIIGTAKPLLIGETGYSTITTNTFSADVSQTQISQEAEQDQYIRTVEYAARQAGLPLASPWNYSDFADNANVLPGYLGTDQQYFGLYRADATLKPAALTTGRIFHGTAIGLAFNNGFENCDTLNVPTLWRVYQSTTQGFSGTFACDSAISHAGSRSVSISNSTTSSSGAPGFYLSPIQYIVAHQSYTATVWARGTDITGNPHISFSWYDKNQVYLGKSASSDLAQGTSNWTRLSVTATSPANAVSVEIHLEVTGTNPGTAWFDDVTFK